MRKIRPLDRELLLALDDDLRRALPGDIVDRLRPYLQVEIEIVATERGAWKIRVCRLNHRGKNVVAQLRRLPCQP